MSARLDPNVRYRRDGELPFRVLAGETVLVDPRRREVHVLNDTATRIWELLAEARSIGELQAHLRDEYDVEARLLAREVNSFLELLSERGLLVREDARAA